MSEKERGPREASEASRSNTPWSINRTTHSRIDELPIKVGLHQGSGLSPFLFIAVLDVISEEFRCGLPRELLFGNDLAVVTDIEEEMQRSWLGWKIGMESKGLKVNIGKTEVMVSSRRGTKLNIKDSKSTSLRQVNKFKYLGVTISEEGGSEEAVRARVSAAWCKWRDLSGVIGDKKMPRKLKTKIYMTVIRPEGGTDSRETRDEDERSNIERQSKECGHHKGARCE